MKPLNQFRYKLATPDEDRTYNKNKISREESIDKLKLMFSGSFDSDPDYNERHSITSDIERKLKDRAQRSLANAEYIAYGYSLPRQPSDQLIEIPIDVWSDWPGVNWDKNSVKNNGLKFINVCVKMSDDITGIEQQRPPNRDPADKPKLPGRPNISNMLIAAYDDLLEKGEVDISAPKSALFAPVINRAVQLFPEQALNIQNVKDTTLYKALPSR